MSQIIACPRVHSSPTMLSTSNLQLMDNNLSQCNILIEAVDGSSQKELQIHSLLNELCVHKINISEYLQDK